MFFVQMRKPGLAKAEKMLEMSCDWCGATGSDGKFWQCKVIRIQQIALLIGTFKAGRNSQLAACLVLVSASPVARTEKKTETEPNRTIGCGCLILALSLYFLIHYFYMFYFYPTVIVTLSSLRALMPCVPFSPVYLLSSFLSSCARSYDYFTYSFYSFHSL
jgi:hypothetical protein